jgi:hypothetical protein
LHRANIAHKECEWKDGDRGGFAEWEQTERKKKEKLCLDVNRPSHGRTWHGHAKERAEARNGTSIKRLDTPMRVGLTDELFPFTMAAFDAS